MDPQPQPVVPAQLNNDKLGFSRFLHKRALVIVFVAIGSVLYILLNVFIYTHGKFPFSFPFQFGKTKTQTSQATKTNPFNLPAGYYTSKKTVTKVSKVSGVVTNVTKDTLTLKINAENLVVTPQSDPNGTPPPPPPIGLVELTIHYGFATKLSRMEGSTNKTKPTTIATLAPGTQIAFSGTANSDNMTFDATELFLP